MIGSLRGLVLGKDEGQLWLDVGGVGYLAHCSDRTLESLPSKGHEATIYTELLVREDLLQLFGFSTPAERAWYRLLVSVQGVGPKAALMLLGHLGLATLGRALTLGDTATIRTAPGIGPKIAARICTELRDKAAQLAQKTPHEMNAAQDIPLSSQNIRTSKTVGTVKTEPPSSASAHVEFEAISALVNLGYDRITAVETISRIYNSGEIQASLGETIKMALRILVKE